MAKRPRFGNDWRMDATVAAVPGYFATMGAEHLILKVVSLAWRG